MTPITVLPSVADVARSLIVWLECAACELPEADRARIHSLTAVPKRPAYEEAEENRIAWARMHLDARIDELVAWIKQGTPDAARARIHALTRKVSLSDQEIENLVNHIATTCYPRMGLREQLFDLRDRYEERGKYAPPPEGGTPAAKRHA